MQNLEQKVDIMLQNQGEIQDSIRKIRDVELNILQTQGDILRTQYKMQEDIFNLKENQIKMQEDIEKLDKKIDDNYEKLDKKIDDNYQKLDEKIDKNAVDTSEIFQDICVKLDELSNLNPKPKLTILK